VWTCEWQHRASQRGTHGIGHQPRQALPAWQVIEIPRPDDDQPSDALEDRVQSLALAYGCAAPAALAWVREQSGGPVGVLVAGAGLAGGEDAAQTLLTIPSGARGVPLPDGGAVQALAAIPYWTRIAGVTDVLLMGSSGPGSGPSLERGLLTSWLDAFAWLVLAEPVGQAVINDLAADASHQQLFAEQNRGPRAQLAARRAEAWHGTLSMGTPGCATEEPAYLAPAYRWSQVKDALKTAVRSGGTGRHPCSDEWERVYGEPVPGARVAERARIVNRWSARDHDDAAAVSAVIWGTGPRTRIEQAVGTRASDPAWPARLADLLDAFVTVVWPRNLLRRTPEAERR
jgi:hypothetical protein